MVSTPVSYLHIPFVVLKRCAAAQNFLINAATILIIDTLINETRKLLELWVPRDVPTEWDSRGRPVHRDHLSTVTWLLDLALLAALVMAIYGATRTSAAFEGNQGAIDTLDDLRKGSSIVILSTFFLEKLSVADIHVTRTPRSCRELVRRWVVLVQPAIPTSTTPDVLSSGRGPAPRRFCCIPGCGSVPCIRVRRNCCFLVCTCCP